jgi:hypothetical protein
MRNAVAIIAVVAVVAVAGLAGRHADRAAESGRARGIEAAGYNEPESQVEARMQLQVAQAQWAQFQRSF